MRRDARRLGAEADAVDALIVSAPRPNPAHTSTRLRIAAPTGARIEATVFDALGRVVARHDDVSRDLRLDVSALASGVYAVRVATGAQTVTHRLTIVR